MATDPIICPACRQPAALPQQMQCYKSYNQALTEPPQLSIGAVIVCNTRTETLHAVGIALAKIGSVNAERLSHQDERLPPRCKQAVGVK